MRKFPSLVELQKENGLLFMEGKTTEKSCADFIDFLGQSMRDHLTQVLSGAKFFSLAFDGSQARKTKTEKELVYAKLVVCKKMLNPVNTPSPSPTQIHTYTTPTHRCWLWRHTCKTDLLRLRDVVIVNIILSFTTPTYLGVKRFRF